MSGNVIFAIVALVLLSPIMLIGYGGVLKEDANMPSAPMVVTIAIGFIILVAGVAMLSKSLG